MPTVHANFRCFRAEGAEPWFGGGADLTPYYPFEEDAVALPSQRARRVRAVRRRRYPRFKKWCDEYFFLPHRGETRGVGGIFFDYLDEGASSGRFAFVRSAATRSCRPTCRSSSAAGPTPYGEREREFQLYRRGRYVEFNLLYDRGTLFGLKTGGRTESILMSLPPLVRWDYDYAPSRVARGAELLEFLKPRDWL